MHIKHIQIHIQIQVHKHIQTHTQVVVPFGSRFEYPFLGSLLTTPISPGKAASSDRKGFWLEQAIPQGLNKPYKAFTPKNGNTQARAAASPESPEALNP